MFNFRVSLLFIIISMISTGCASRHSGMSGSVAMKINNSKGVACLFGKNPRVGDELVLFQNECSEIGSEKGGLSCKMVKSGKGTITKMINDHYAEFETKSNVSFNEGYIIELSK